MPSKRADLDGFDNARHRALVRHNDPAPAEGSKYGHHEVAKRALAWYDQEMHSPQALLALLVTAASVACGSPSSPSAPEAASPQGTGASPPAATPSTAPAGSANEPQVCAAARNARARSSPTAPALAKQCEAAGGVP